MTNETVDAVVIGAGPNGLVAANALADAGWDVLVLEASDDGRRRGPQRRGDRAGLPSPTCSARSTRWRAASPVIRGLDLERSRADLAARARRAGPRPAGRPRAPCCTATPSAPRPAWTSSRAGDGAGLAGPVRAAGSGSGDPLLDALFTPFPPVRAGARAAAPARVAGSLRPGPARACCRSAGWAEEMFDGDGGAAAAGRQRDAQRRAAGRGGQRRSSAGCWPCSARTSASRCRRAAPERWPQALLRRLEARGGQVRTGARVTAVLVAGGRAVGVRTPTAARSGPAAAVLADVPAPALYRDLVGLRAPAAAIRAGAATDSSGTTPR